MKIIEKRLRRLEQRLVPPSDTKADEFARVLRERRRLRLEASGQPSEEPPRGEEPVGPVRRLSFAVALRLERQRARAQSRTARSSPAGTATDNNE
jgi:hypothetical protein